MIKCKLLVSAFGYEKDDVGEIINILGDDIIVYVKDRTSTSCYYPCVVFSSNEVEIIKDEAT